MNESLFRQNCYQEVILKESNLQSFSFREDAKGGQESKNQKYSFSQGDFWMLRDEILTQSEIAQQRAQDLIENDRDLCKNLQMEREKNEQLQIEIQKMNMMLTQEYRQNNDDQDEELHQESYIEEIETQLQEARAALLETKCILTDKDEEIKVLQNQITLLQNSMQILDEEKKDLDSLVIKVSQELRLKESTDAQQNQQKQQQHQQPQYDITYQLQLDKDHLMKQIEILKKELQEERQKQNNLELLEGNLVHQLENKEQENLEIKAFLQDLEDKINLKTDAIEKAQKVIQKLNEELQRTLDEMGKIEQERDNLKRENKEQNKRVLELNKQVQSQMNQHYTNSAQINSQLKTEVDELKEVLKQYQNEYELEKRQLTETVRNLNEQKYQVQQDRDKLEINIKKTQNYFQDQLQSKEEVIKQLEEKAQFLSKEMKFVEDDLKRQIEQKEIQAQSNILYLQKRIKELSYEIYKSQNLKGENKIEALSYLSTVKQEFEKVSKEVINIKKYIKQECLDKLGVSGKIRQFEEFQIVVMRSLMEWERKTHDLQQFVKSQQNSQEEQRQMFANLKGIIKAKDQLIYSQQKQLQDREQQLKAQVGTIKKEIERSHYIMKTDLIGTVVALDNENQHLSNETYDIEKRFSNFRLEFSQILDERDQMRNENLSLQGEVEMIRRDINKVDDEFFTFREKLRAILDIRKQGESGHVLIIPTLENLIEELELRKEESSIYKMQNDDYQRQADDEKRFLQGRIKAVEEQLEQIQRQTISKEEEIQIIQLQKETRYINEIQKMQADCSSSANEVQIRERQLKKMQQKQDMSSYEIQCLMKELDKIKQENQDLYDRESRTNTDIKYIQESLDKSQSELDQKIKSLNEMENQLSSIEEKCRTLKDTNKELEKQVEKEKVLNLQLQEEKYKIKNTLEITDEKVSILERENTSLYNEISRGKTDHQELARDYQEIEKERNYLQREVDIMNKAIVDAQNEISESQRVIDQLNEAIEESKAKDYQINDLKNEIRSLKSNEVRYCDQIAQLKLKLYPNRSHAETQTPESGIQEIYFLRDEAQKLSQELISQQNQGDQLRDMIQRQSQQIDRLIEEKRDYENIIEQQNVSIKQQKNNGGSYKENYNTQNSLTVSAHKANNNTTMNTSFVMNSNELYSQILQEKENYIIRLEQEISDMRRENDYLKEKVVIHEIDTLTFEKQEPSIQLRHQQQNYQLANQSQQQMINTSNYQSKRSVIGSAAQSNIKLNNQLQLGGYIQSNQKQPNNYQKVNFTPIQPQHHQQSNERMGSQNNMHNKSMQYHL